MEVYVPTAHKIVIDVNNYSCDGTSWAGNDNDNTNCRTATTFEVPANTWTTISWGSSNTHSSNTNHASIYVLDTTCLYTADDTANVVWYIRNIKVQMGKNITAWTPSPYETPIMNSTSKLWIAGVDSSNYHKSLRHNTAIYTSGTVLYGAAWNDYAEFRDQETSIKPGYCAIS